jgi:major vault protein
MAETDRKRELALAPGEYAYVQDGTNGKIKTHVGPTTLTLTNQDKPVKFNTTTYRFDECVLEQAVQQNIVAPEGHYVVLLNPAKRPVRTSNDPAAPTVLADWHPEAGTGQTPDFQVGEKENVPGPVSFALWPGQMAEVRRGHHLRLNEYLRIKIYNDDKAKSNWAKGVVKIAEDAAGQGGTAAPVTSRQAPPDLAVGKQYNIPGREVSFYIPPTGVSVVPDEQTAEFVRDAETLEQLEYSVLVDEDGNKEYPRGPAVVFPKPTQQFLKDRNGNRKFRAVEMNELQGIQLKFTKEVTLTFADGAPTDFTPGEEVFITGKEMPIYFPEEGHQLVRYDGKTIHYAVAVPEGEARYVMDRKTGKIRTVKGPQMLLPNPVTEIIVRRALSDSESVSMFPGADGTGSHMALEYNRWLRSLAGAEPTTRQGVVSDGSVTRSAVSSSSAPAAAAIAMNMVADSSSMANYSQADAGFDAIESYSNAATERGTSPRRVAKTKALMSESRQGKQQEAMLGDVAERKSTYNEPRTITFANMYKGVPTIRVQQGYAVQVSDSDGGRRVVVGPRTILLEYAESLDALHLSTGKPKSTDRLFAAAYLNIANNKVTDIIDVETVDHVRVQIKLVYNVNFEGDQSKWFTIENYVKHLCDHSRSVLKGKVRKLTIDEFYRNSTDIIRDYVLGPNANPDGSPTKRSGMAFPENGMRVTDVEVLGVIITDADVSSLLLRQQRTVVEQNIQLAQRRYQIEIVRELESLKQQELEAQAVTFERTQELEGNKLAAQLQLDLEKIEAEVKRHTELRRVKETSEGLIDFEHNKKLARTQAEYDQADKYKDAEQARATAMITARTQAIIDQMKAVEPQLVAALESVSARETLAKVARELSFHEMFGGESAADFLTKVLSSGPLASFGKKLLESAGGVGINGAGTKATSNSPVA